MYLYSYLNVLRNHPPQMTLIDCEMFPNVDRERLRAELSGWNLHEVVSYLVEEDRPENCQPGPSSRLSTSLNAEAYSTVSSLITLHLPWWTMVVGSWSRRIKFGQEQCSFPSLLSLKIRGCEVGFVLIRLTMKVLMLVHCKVISLKMSSRS